jgi:hypothetical protein
MFVPLIIIGVLTVTFLVTKAWGGFTIMIVSGIFIAHMMLNTYYTITGTALHLRSGFLVNITIDINTIKSIAPSHTLLSSPALSLDRLEINYNTYDSIAVSPKDKTGFIAALKLANNRIEVKE